MLELLWHQFQEGGWAMWAILFWLLCSLTICCERFLYLSGAYQNSEVLMAALHQTLSGSKDVDNAIAMCRAARSPMARIIIGGLERVEEGPSAIQAGMDGVALREFPRITKRIGYLALFANLAMLTGLFGTIVGLIKAFGAVGAESIDPESKARILASGISEAMNCTAFGLLSAIIALVGYAVFTAWSQNIEAAIHRETVHLYNLVNEIFG